MILPNLTAIPNLSATAIDDSPALEDSAQLVEHYSAHNYNPLPVTLVSGFGAWVVDEHGQRYLDFLSGYSALNFGHRHPRLIAAAHAQLDRLTLTSRAFHNDQLGPFCAELADLVQMDGVLPMNTGVEAVETAIKAARRWATDVKGVKDGASTIITAEGNFHGRTTTVVGFSTDEESRRGFGPFSPGFVTVPFGDAAAVEAAIDDNTAAILVEPVQGEAGVIVPPKGYLTELARICKHHGVLLILDEIQSGLGRTGRTLACDHENVKPDMLILGKALGGGIIPLSALVAKRSVLDVFTPGSHGSTFGGNPLACAVGRQVVGMLETGEFQHRAAHLGNLMAEALGAMESGTISGSDGAPAITAVRCHGLWAGIDIAGDETAGRRRAVALMARGVLAKETHGRTLRLAPPLVISEEDLLWAIDQLAAVIKQMV